MSRIPVFTALWITSVVAAVGVATFLVAGLVLAKLVDPNPFPLTGLQSPRGLTVLEDGQLLVAEVLGGRLLRLDPKGKVSVVQERLPATFGGPGEQYPTGVSAAALVDGTYYYVVGEFRGSRYSTLYRLDPAGPPEALAGGVGRDGFPASRLTNPYDLVAAPQGGFLVSDSGINGVLHISGTGVISEYALFPRRELNTGPEDYTFDVVPTGLTLGPDGALYLASFTGYPYLPGAAYIYRLEDRNRDGDAMDSGEVTVYAEGFSAATDLAFAGDGSLLVTEFSADMLGLITDYDIDQAAEIPGRLVRWREGNIEVVAEGLVSPTSVAVLPGRIFVSEEFAGRVTEIGARPSDENWPKAASVAAGLLAAALLLAALIWWQRNHRRVAAGLDSSS
ncbi:MAG: ScyD/ScyE family protein [Dehalococcoidia bacterium]